MSKKIRNTPVRTFFLVLFVIIFLLLLHLLPEMTIASVKLRNVNILCDIYPDKQESSETAIQVKIPKLHQQNNKFKETFPPGVTCIEDYGNDYDMDYFYSALNNVNKMSRPVRIAYFGDSFIEGDIVTGDLRQLLQSKYGGKGVGWVDCASITSSFRKTVYETSKGWISHSIVEHGFNRDIQGINQRYFIPKGQACTMLKCSNNRANSKTCELSEIYYYSKHPFKLSATVNGESSKTYSIAVNKLSTAKATGNINNIRWNIKEATNSSYFYGITMESNKGVIVDNFSMRGSPGFTLSSIPKQTLISFSKLRPYDLIIIQYGLNVAKDICPAAYYRLYQHRMEKVVNSIKSVYPHTSILIASVSDRCSRDMNGICTSSGIKPLTIYQQMIAANTHVAFFNLFKAMKSKGGMKEMVDKKQANLDYTHLNFKGGRVIGKCFFDALIAGKVNYDKRNLILK
jgi:lysophospholipase L1-like esterase